VHFKFTLAANNLNLGSLPQDASNNNFAITNVDGETSTTLNATTQFVTDADVVEATVNKPISISNVLYNSSITRNEEDIKSFLANHVLHIQVCFHLPIQCLRFLPLMYRLLP